MKVTSEKVRKLLNKHLPKVGDAYRPCEYVNNNTNKDNYNPENGAVTPTTTTHAVNAVLADFSFNRNQAGTMQVEDETILSIDKKAIMITDQLPDSIKIKKDDQLKDLTDNTVYNIIGWNVDPYKGACIFHLRPIEVP